MRAVACLAAAVLAGTAAAVALAGSPRAAREADAACLPQAAHAPNVGHLTKIVSGDVHRGKTLLTTDDAPLNTNSTLCTDGDGQVKFLVEFLKKTGCRLDPRGRLRLYPPKLDPGHRQVVIRFEQGATWCGTGGDATENEKKYDANKGQVRLLVKDPLFAVAVDTQQTVVKVALGYVEVSRLAGAGAVIVGADQQVRVPDGGEPQSVEAIDLTPTDTARFAELKPDVPKPDFRRPDPDGSAALVSIFERGYVVVGLDRQGIADQATEPFVKRLFGFLASSWRVKVRFRDLTRANVPGALKAKAVDVAVTTDTTLPAQLDTLATFVDGARTVWRTALLQDSVFLAALRRFLTATVSSGDYATFYRAAFNTEPPYAPLHATLFG